MPDTRGFVYSSHNRIVFDNSFIELKKELESYPTIAKALKGVSPFRILFKLFTKISKEIIDNGYSFKFRGLGSFYVVASKYKVTEIEGGFFHTKPINKKATLELRKETGDQDAVVYHNNEHSDGHVYRLLWNVNKVNFKNRTFYKFRASRTNRQRITKAIHDGSITAEKLDLNIRT